VSVQGKAIQVGERLETSGFSSRVALFFRQPINWVFLTITGIIGFLSLYPTFFLFYGSFTDAPLGLPGNFTLENYIRAYSDPEAYPLLFNSFIFGIGASGLSIVFALTLAWITIRTNAPLRRLFELTAIIPNILPPILVSISWVMLLNPSNGLINASLVKIFGLEQGPFNIYSMPGLIFVEALILTPLAFLIVAAALKSMDPSLEESAKTLGSGEFGVMRRITFPLIRPAILAAATLNFVRAVESFDTPAIIALPARIEVFTTKIWREALGSFPTNHNLAATYGVGILAIALLFVYLYRRFTSQVESFSTVTGKGFRPHQIDLGPWRFAATGLAFSLLVLLVVLPILVLLLVALLPYYHVPTWQTWQNLSVDNFRYVWATPRVHRAFMNSIILALVGATVCMLLASLASYITVRTRITGRGIIEALVFIPWAFPGTALALGLLWAYVDFPIPIYATIWIILIAYVTRFLPYGLRAVTSTIIQVHKELEEASIVCGAGFLATFRRVLIPMMRPGVMAGWIILVTIFMREFSATLFLYSPGAEPLGPLLYFLYLDGMRGRVAAIGLVISVISVILIAAAQRYSRWDTQ
jgi:iron(III) transport system permease protein